MRQRVEEGERATVSFVGVDCAGNGKLRAKRASERVLWCSAAKSHQICSNTNRARYHRPGKKSVTEADKGQLSTDPSEAQ